MQTFDERQRQAEAYDMLLEHYEEAMSRPSYRVRERYDNEYGDNPRYLLTYEVVPGKTCDTSIGIQDLGADFDRKLRLALQARVDHCLECDGIGEVPVDKDPITGRIEYGPCPMCKFARETIAGLKSKTEPATGE